MVRDPPAKGSYYNKFVGDLRSGNNSELRVTLRMCLSLLLFKWEWKATSCAGCDLHLSLFPPLLLYFLSSPAVAPATWKNRFEKRGASLSGKVERSIRVRTKRCFRFF